ncbi:septum formation family protein [Nocardioides sp. ChNu-153]|uniref:DUF4190 domain-containing protein n=1 Tax=unclassified Nocardioides TaxID=2615069 RepID=UPI002404A2C8|nr:MULTISPECIES: DUF4190 domain-containing protein [unclassified Nocardioides]MDF9716364.1 septum formation family protein [Nocardioides sp. ChNu-99]MDN7122870.1 septum formation family protein [Nocardioides sp. ChNu-153]
MSTQTPHPAPAPQHPPYPLPWQPPVREDAGLVPTLALALACVPLVVTNLLGVVLGAIGLGSRPRGRPGRGMAVAALVVGTAWLAVAAVVGTVLLVQAGDTARREATVERLQGDVQELRDELDEVGAGFDAGFDEGFDEDYAMDPEELGDAEERASVTPLAQDVPLVDLAAGDCVLDHELNYQLWWGDPLETVAATVDCAGWHDAELAGFVEVDGDDYPDEDTLWDEVGFDCDDLFFSYAGEANYAGAETTYPAFVPPTEEAWDAGERRVACFASSEELVEGSLRGVARG